MEARERRNNTVGILTSVGVHAIMLLILFFVVAWRAPDPPLPEYGIELNFGLDDQGSGDVQPEELVGDDGDAQTEESPQEQVQEESVAAEKASETTPEKTEEPVVSKTESPVTVKEEPKPTESKETTKPETKKLAPESVYKPADAKTKETAQTDATKKGDAASQGDAKKKTGDEGSEEGKLDAKALYGVPGGGGGGDGDGLQMGGWTWAEKPVIPEIPDNEDGKIVFVIECDENGDITGITTEVRTLSVKAEQLLREMIQKHSLVRTAGGTPPQKSTGRFVFNFRTK